MEKLGVDVAACSLFGCMYFLYHCAFLAWRDGRTLGKAAMDICVISSQGRPVNLREAILRTSVRACPFAVMALPGLRATGAGLILLGALFLCEVWMLERLPARLTIADRVARTLVVNTPPPQPHRAPAAPMFSAADAEFGIPPKRPSERPTNWTK